MAPELRWPKMPVAARLHARAHAVCAGGGHSPCRVVQRVTSLTSKEDFHVQIFLYPFVSRRKLRGTTRGNGRRVSSRAPVHLSARSVSSGSDHRAVHRILRSGRTGGHLSSRRDRVRLRSTALRNRCRDRPVRRPVSARRDLRRQRGEPVRVRLAVPNGRAKRLRRRLPAGPRLSPARAGLHVRAAAAVRIRRGDRRRMRRLLSRGNDLRCEADGGRSLVYLSVTDLR